MLRKSESKGLNLSTFMLLLEARSKAPFSARSTQYGSFSASSTQQRFFFYTQHRRDDYAAEGRNVGIVVPAQRRSCFAR